MPHAHITTTTTHKSLRGPRGGLVLAQEEFAADVDRGCPMVLVLTNTTPGTNKAGAPSKATYNTADGVAERVQGRADEMLERHPLYPGLELT